MTYRLRHITMHNRWRCGAAALRRALLFPLLSPLLIAAVACNDSTSPLSRDKDGPPAARVAGATYTDARGYVEYTGGDAPVILTAPHGGDLAPSRFADRSCAGCILGLDRNTQELARVVADRFYARTGRHLHLIVSRLHRRKFDANRPVEEAVDGNVALVGTWLWYHAAVDSARAEIARTHGRGVLLDLHGHAHPSQRIELGYDIPAGALQMSDAALDRSPVLHSSSIARLLHTSATLHRPVEVLRGPFSLGSLLNTRGVPAMPSSVAPSPVGGEPYFDGGYTSSRTGSAASGVVDGILVECHFGGIRDTAASREQFAEALVEALLEFLELHYAWRPANQATAP